MRYTDKSRAAVAPVSLGFGTLIIIAIIVAVFGDPDLGPLQNRVGQIQGSVGRLEDAVGAQMREIRRLQNMITQLQAANAAQNDAAQNDAAQDAAAQDGAAQDDAAQDEAAQDNAANDE